MNEELEALLNYYFDKKYQNFNFRNDVGFEKEIKEMQQRCIKEIQETATDWVYEIDEKLEDWERIHHKEHLMQDRYEFENQLKKEGDY